MMRDCVPVLIMYVGERISLRLTPKCMCLNIMKNNVWRLILVDKLFNLLNFKIKSQTNLYS